MTLDDIFDQLTYGELSHLFITPGAVPATGLPADKRKGIFLSVQLGLTELYKRFKLREGSLTIGLAADKYSYLLTTRYAESNLKSTGVVKHILDADSPFLDDLLQIEKVYSEDGTELPLNMLDDEDSIMTPSFNSIVIPDDLEGDTLRIQYRANHPVLQAHVAIAAPSIVTIDLPPTHLKALLLWVASRVHTKPISMDMFHDGNNYYGKFEAACAELVNSGFHVENSGVNDRLRSKGWV